MIRQSNLINNGDVIIEETRVYHPEQDKTTSLFSKEIWDYRYLTDPDLPVFAITDERIRRIKKTLVKTPFEKKLESVEEFRIPVKDVTTVHAHPWSIPIFTRLVKEGNRDPKTTFNW
jgi:aspartyl-tRNA(Asn)/glutamyl-tRNA(Gln) amidotransferase subunit B